MFVIKTYKTGFTIVELLVVIVVIGILAAITIVSYTGINQKAIVASLQSDLSNASKKLKMYYIDNGVYPTSLDGSYCPTGPLDTRYCLKPSGFNSFTDYDVDNSTSDKYFHLMARNSTTCYEIDNNSSSILNASCAYYPTVTIGTQVWMKNNLNVGTKISGATSQSNNGIIEKYCWNGDENNCTNYGGALYQWGEAVQYQNGASNTVSPSPAFSGNIQGICPTNFHIPSDAEWTALEAYLAPNPGTKLIQGGSSGFNTLFVGYLIFGTGYASQGTNVNFWTSSERIASTAWYRALWSTDGTVTRSSWNKTDGYSVRCLKN